MIRHTAWSFAISDVILNSVLLGALLFTAAILPASAQEKPKIRTITAFIRLDPNQYTQQFADTISMLRNAQARYELAGYEVETIRISTQPFPEYTRGMSKEAALAFFKDLDAIAKRENVSICIGPALMTENDDLAQAQLLAEILAQSSSLYGSVVVAASDGVHWKAVRAAADDMKYLEDHSRARPRQFPFRRDCQRSRLHAVLSRVVSPGPGPSIRHCARIRECRGRCHGCAARSGGDPAGPGC